MTSEIDEFTSQLSADDARVLVDLLKLAVASRAGPRARDTLSRLLTGLARFNPAVYTSVLCSGTSDCCKMYILCCDSKIWCQSVVPRIVI